MGRLRIAVVTPELPNREYPNRGLSIYRTLLQLCDSAEIQALCPLPRYPVGVHPRFDYRPCDLTYSPPGVPTHFFDYPAFPIVTRPFNGFTCAHYLEPRIRAFHADVILNFLLYPVGFAALTVGRKLHLPVVVGSIGSDLNAIPDPVSRWLTRKTLNGASRVIAKSQQLRRRAIEMGVDSEKAHVVANGCDGDLFFLRDRRFARSELNISPKGDVVVFAGRMHRPKGIFELLEAVAALSRKRPNLRLVYVGDGPELGALKERVRFSNLVRFVEFAGACSSAEVARWLAAANLLALPSYAEGCPNVILEALNCGRPVVATQVGDIPELVDRSCGLLIPVGDVEALTSAMDSALDSTWDEDLIAKRFRRSWKNVAQEVLAICEASLDDGQARCARN